MLELIAALALQAIQAECVLSAEGRDITRRGPTRLLAECPDTVEDANELLRLAQEGLARIDYDLERAQEAEFIVADTVTFEHDGSGWRARPGQQVIVRTAVFPDFSNRLANWMVCSAGARPDNRGRADSPVVYCTSDTSDRRHIEAMDARWRTALVNSRFFPVDMEYCVDLQYADYNEIYHDYTGERWTGGGPMPDPAELPNLCIESVPERG